MPLHKPPITVMWYKCTDLRVHDHLPLRNAHRQPYPVLHLFVFDPFWFKPLPLTRLPKTGPIRAKFLLESVEDLRNSLRQQGTDLVVRHGPTAAVFAELMQTYTIEAVHAYREVCSQEVKIERAVAATIRPAPLLLEWGFSLYHRDDLPPGLLRRFPKTYSGFRRAAQEQSSVRPPVGMGRDAPPMRFRPNPTGIDAGALPTLPDLGLTGLPDDPRAACKFVGGETAGMARVREYLWDKDLLRNFVGATNTMTPGKIAILPDSTSKFSPWLAHGCISPQWLYQEIEDYERRRVRNKSTSWLKHELVWRDFLRFGGLAECWGDSIFKPSGIDQELGRIVWDKDMDQYKMWVEGRTGFPFVDCFMKELAATGYTTHCGRECVAWFFVRDLATDKGWMDWRIGAEYFEHILVDFEPTANWGNWAYRIATTTPNGTPSGQPMTRSTEMLLWAHDHDPNAFWVKRWLPALRSLPAVLALEPWRLMNPESQSHLDPPSGNRWQCPACTFENSPNQTRCGMCRVTPRPVSYKGFVYGVDFPYPCIMPQCGRRRAIDFSETNDIEEPSSPSTFSDNGMSVSESSASPPASPIRSTPKPPKPAPKSRQRNRIQTDRR